MSKGKEKAVFDLETASKEEIQAKITELETTVEALEEENQNFLNRLEEKTAEYEQLKAEKKSESSGGKKKVNSKGEVKLKFLFSPAGAFLLPYNVGQIVALPENQADELVEARYAEYV